MWRRLARWASAALLVAGTAAHAAPAGHYLFAWAGDTAKQGQDFIMVIDADPASPGYGKLVASAASGIQTHQVHHTEYWMPDGGLLFANDHISGQTVVMDLRDPLHPGVHASFKDLDGFSHPHSFLRLPNGHVLASFQVEGQMNHAGMDHEMAGMAMPMTDIGARPDVHGGLVEIDDEGHAVRAASTADPERPNDLLMAYSLLPLPDIDRVIVTNSSMRDEDRIGHTYQVFRLSDLKRLSTNDLDAPAGRYGETNPEEARLGPDGAVYVQTTGCGIERVSDIASDHPRSKLVWQFPGSFCGVPSIVSHYLIQSVPILHAIVVLDIRDGDHPAEVTRVVLDPTISPHWTGYDAKTHRLAVTGYDEDRLFMLSFDPDTGALAIDAAFHDDKGKPGFDLDNRTWPHGWTGSAIAHGVVFSK
ncbi:hypothetical protein [Phenylobacterium montanum]|uniref:Selenium-binding protein n=1 Tax=Phenylobacterium montanum TaxID=2823693 RepID=A0A975FWI1_9CAUL|nr:hypothetical protein [Caulobacter sp. S6]QUD86590.1 hypothetical protein KCG34_16055 [Caulobacter sp. S6]